MNLKLSLFLLFSLLYANEPIEWGRLDSVGGLMYLERDLFTGRVYKQLDIGKIVIDCEVRESLVTDSATSEFVLAFSIKPKVL